MATFGMLITTLFANPLNAFGNENLELLISQVHRFDRAAILSCLVQQKWSGCYDNKMLKSDHDMVAVANAMKTTFNSWTDEQRVAVLARVNGFVIAVEEMPMAVFEMLDHCPVDDLVAIIRKQSTPQVLKKRALQVVTTEAENRRFEHRIRGFRSSRRSAGCITFFSIGSLFLIGSLTTLILSATKLGIADYQLGKAEKVLERNCDATYKCPKEITDILPLTTTKEEIAYRTCYQCHPGFTTCSTYYNGGGYGGFNSYSSYSRTTCSNNCYYTTCNPYTVTRTVNIEYVRRRTAEPLGVMIGYVNDGICTIVNKGIIQSTDYKIIAQQCYALDALRHDRKGDRVPWEGLTIASGIITPVWGVIFFFIGFEIERERVYLNK